MCGRFERHSALSEFSKIVAGLVAEGIDPLPPSYNIAPSRLHWWYDIRLVHTGLTCSPGDWCRAG